MNKTIEAIKKNVSTQKASNYTGLESSANYETLSSYISHIKQLYLQK